MVHSAQRLKSLKGNSGLWEALHGGLQGKQRVDWDNGDEISHAKISAR